MSRPDITRDEWLAALGAEAVEIDDQGAVTIMEIAAMLGRDRMAAYRYVLRLLAEGRAVSTHKRVRIVGGATRRVQAYRLVKPPAAPTVGRGAGAAAPSGIPTRRSRHASPRRPRPTRRSTR